MEDIIDEAAQSDSEREDEFLKPPPKKKRKISKKKKKILIEEEETPTEASPESVERTEEEKLQRKELELLLLKNPTIDVSKVLDISSKVEKMTPEQVKIFLDAANTQLDLQCPFSSAENLITLGSLALQRLLGDNTLYSRCSSDTRLIAAVNSLVPSFSNYVGVRLEVLGRVATHVWDGKYNVTENNK